LVGSEVVHVRTRHAGHISASEGTFGVVGTAFANFYLTGVFVRNHKVTGGEAGPVGVGVVREEGFLLHACVHS